MRVTGYTSGTSRTHKATPPDLPCATATKSSTSRNLKNGSFVTGLARPQCAHAVMGLALEEAGAGVRVMTVHIPNQLLEHIECVQMGPCESRYNQNK